MLSRLDRKRLDAAFPTFVRYLGSVLTVVLVVASIFGVPATTLAAAYVAAAGMILYKTVAGAANGRANGNGNGNDRGERWSHLE
jgi:hypothetical protein